MTRWGLPYSDTLAVDRCGRQCSLCLSYRRPSVTALDPTRLYAGPSGDPGGSRSAACANHRIAPYRGHGAGPLHGRRAIDDTGPSRVTGSRRTGATQLA
jgi:hypothetical protein